MKPKINRGLKAPRGAQPMLSRNTKLPLTEQEMAAMDRKAEHAASARIAAVTEGAGEAGTPPPGDAPGESAPTPPATPKKAVKAAKPPGKPWDGADPKRIYGNTVKIPYPLYLKLAWMKENVPGPDRSIQKILVTALEHHADAMIQKHWKEPT